MEWRGWIRTTQCDVWGTITETQLVNQFEVPPPRTTHMTQSTPSCVVTLIQTSTTSSAAAHEVHGRLQLCLTISFNYRCWPSYKVFQNVHFIGIFVFYNIISYRGYFSANIRIFSLFSWRTFAAIIDDHGAGFYQVLYHVLGRRVWSFLSWLVFVINKPSGGYFRICNTSSSYLSIMAQLGQFVWVRWAWWTGPWW